MKRPYVCADGLEVRVPPRLASCRRLGQTKIPKNCIFYQRRQRQLIRAVFVSGNAFDRDLHTTVGGAAETRTITFPRTTTHIARTAFLGCQKLRSVRFPPKSKLEEIGRSSFAQSGLEKVSIPSSVKTIGDSTFKNCKNLRKVKFPDGAALETLGQKCFLGTALEELVLPATLREVGEGAFGECAKFREVRVGESFSLDVCALVPPSVRVLPLPALVGSERLYSLREVKTLVLPSGLARVGNYWFADSLVEEVRFSASVAEIGGWAFQGCFGLRRVVFASGSLLQRIGQGAFRNSGLREIAFPASLLALGDEAFSGCGSLVFADLEKCSALREIGAFCFHGCGIARLAVPASVVAIGRGAFQKCQSLAEVRYEAGSRLCFQGQLGFYGCALRLLVLSREVRRIVLESQVCCAVQRVAYAEDAAFGK